MSDTLYMANFRIRGVEIVYWHIRVRHYNMQLGYGKNVIDSLSEVSAVALATSLELAAPPSGSGLHMPFWDRVGLRGRTDTEATRIYGAVDVPSAASPHSVLVA